MQTVDLLPTILGALGASPTPTGRFTATICCLLSGASRPRSRLRLHGHGRRGIRHPDPSLAPDPSLGVRPGRTAVRRALSQARGPLGPEQRDRSASRGRRASRANASADSSRPLAAIRSRTWSPSATLLALEPSAACPEGSTGAGPAWGEAPRRAVAAARLAPVVLKLHRCVVARAVAPPALHLVPELRQHSLVQPACLAGWGTRRGCDDGLRTR